MRTFELYSVVPIIHKPRLKTFLHVSDVMLATQSDMPIFTVVLNQLVRQLVSILHKYCATTVLFLYPIYM